MPTACEPWPGKTSAVANALAPLLGGDVENLLPFICAAVRAYLMGWTLLMTGGALDQMRHPGVEVRASLALARVRGSSFWQWWQRNSPYSFVASPDSSDLRTANRS